MSRSSVKSRPVTWVLGTALTLAATMICAFAETSSTGNPLLDGLPKDLQESLQPPKSVDTPEQEDGIVDLAYGAFQRGYYLSAFAIATRNAGLGESAAQSLLGLIYEHGYGIPQDLNKSASWYQLASLSGDREAEYRLGLLYLDGLGVPRNRMKAAEYFGLAAEKGQPKAAYNLGLFYLEDDIFERDFKKAADLFRIASEANNADAQYALALMYKRGQGVAADNSQSAILFRNAAVSGHLPAQVELAIMVFNGIGTEKNEEQAAQWFKQAAQSKNPVAMNRLARLYASGLGLPADPIEAGKWHIRARQSGISDLWLDGFLESLDQEKKDEALARAYPRQGDQATALEKDPAPKPDSTLQIDPKLKPALNLKSSQP